MAKIFLKIPGVSKGIIKWAFLLIATGENESSQTLRYPQITWRPC